MSGHQGLRIGSTATACSNWQALTLMVRYFMTTLVRPRKASSSAATLMRYVRPFTLPPARYPAFHNGPRRLRHLIHQSSGFLDLYTQDELTQLVDSSTSEQAASASPSQPTDRTALASLYLMIAIGAQVRGSSKDDAVRASKYFTQGRKIAFEKWLEDPTVSLVRTFVLMAFYMFGACRRNSAFMYLGVAAKSADILGLHAAAQNRHMSKAERDSRSVRPVASKHIENMGPNAQCLLGLTNRMQITSSKEHTSL